MDLGIRGRTAFISGSTAGIGYAIAEALAAEGVAVTLNGRTQERVDGAVAKVRAAYPTATVAGVAADLGSAEGAERIAAAVPSVDILVNNVAVFEPKPFLEIPDADWLQFFETNVLSGVRLTRRYLPGMLERKWGRVVFISSESGLQIPAEMIHYGVTKTAQIALARGIAESVAGTHVTVNSILPGPTLSEGLGGFVAQLAAEQHKDVAQVEKDFFTTMRPSSIIQRFASPAEVAALVTYVVSAQASATTGAALRVDGGVVRSIA
jgi:NAD(P)-dependent dehydrogenase (short-subunit alcohol dehydrogenase family)